MTAHKYVTLWCDDGYDQETGHRPCAERYEDGLLSSATFTRKAARAAGWRYFPGHPATGTGKDYCPRHADRRRSAS